MKAHTIRSIREINLPTLFFDFPFDYISWCVVFSSSFPLQDLNGFGVASVHDTTARSV